MERQFNSAREYQFYLNKGVETEINQEMYGSAVSLPDGDLYLHLHRLSEKLFGNNRSADLTVQQRVSLARILKRETGAGTKQIARAVRLKLKELEPLLNPRKG